jgi:hypothetical protein
MMLNSLLVGLRGQAAMQAEIIALRHQLIVPNEVKFSATDAHSERPLPLGLAVTTPQ